MLCGVRISVLSSMLRNAVYSDTHTNATTMGRKEQEINRQSVNNSKRHQWWESLTNVSSTSFLPSQSASRNHAILDGVITLIRWLICECSNTVEQRMIPGGSNDERLTNIDRRSCYIIMQSSSIPRFPRGSPACIHVKMDLDERQLLMSTDSDDHTRLTHFQATISPHNSYYTNDTVWSSCTPSSHAVSKTPLVVKR